MTTTTVPYRNLSPAPILALLLFCASVGAMALTFNGVVIATWVGCWAFAVFASEGRRRRTALMLLLAIAVFYPEFSTVFIGIHEKVIVLSTVLVLSAVWHYGSARRQLRGERTTRFLAGAWLGWGLLAYAPVLVAWLAVTVLHFQAPDALMALQHETSGIKTAAPVITAALAALVAVAALRDCADFRALRRALEWGVIIVTVLSLTEWAMRRHFVPIDVSRLIPDTTRLEGFSTFDSNALGRLLLIPALLIVSAAVTAPHTLGARGWSALLLAITAIVLTQSRTSYISFSVGVAVLAALNLRKLRVWWILAVAGSWVTGLILWTRLGSAFSEGSERLSLNSLFLRAQLWKSVWQIIVESPWFGAHPSGYAERMVQLRVFDEQVISAHSFYLALGAEWGVPMVVIAVLAIFTTMRYGRRALRTARRCGHYGETQVLAATVVAASLALAVHGITEIISSMYIFFLLGCAVAARRHAESAIFLNQSAAASPAVAPQRGMAA